MKYITGETIKSAVSLKIRECFQSGYPAIYPKIYKEPTSQGFTKPSFFLTHIDVNQRRINKYTYERTYMMNVRYHPEDRTNGVRELLDQIGSDLLIALSTIDVEITVNGTDTTKPVHGKGMEYKIEEEVLQMFVNYTIKVNPEVSADLTMETVTINSQV